MLIINLKNYEKTAFKSGEGILSKCAKYLLANPQANEKVFFIPSLLDLGLFVDKFPGLNFIAPHVDLVFSEKSTGWVTPRSLEILGIDFVLLNHAEHRFETIDLAIAAANKLDAEGFSVIVCCENLAEARKFRDNSDVFAVTLEPAGLIGAGASISTMETETLEKFIEEFKSVPERAFIGVGVTNATDVATGVKLGAEGFMLASAFMKATDHVEFIRDLIAEF